MAEGLKRSLEWPRCDVAELPIAAVAGLALAYAAVFLCAAPFSGRLTGTRDYISYWATGYQLVHHANPYDKAAMTPLEHSAGLAIKATLLMRNPPWALPLAYPLGFLGPRIAAIPWSLILLGCLLLSVRLIRQMHGFLPPGPRPVLGDPGPLSNSLHWLGLGFTPALICLIMGQTTLLALLGLALFLRYHGERPFASGAALWLCLLKPHLFLPFAAALAAWMGMNRSYKILAGALAALAASSAAAFWIDPAAWGDYLRMMRSPGVQNDAIPCLADAIRRWLAPQSIWVQYLPAALGCAWAVLYYWRRRAQWDWKTNASPLMLVSLLTAPYCWFYDQCLAIPALMQGAYITRSRVLLTALSLLILAAFFQLCFVQIASPWWLWPAPAWLAWYLLAMGALGERRRTAGGPLKGCGVATDQGLPSAAAGSNSSVSPRSVCEL
jgi:hypothetical protein